MKRCLLLTTCYLLLASPLSSYYWEFGQNKVQYRGFDWQVIDSDKFSIIYYPGGEELAKFAQSVLNDAYGSLSSALSHKPKEPIPVIIYNSHNNFEQTNVTLSIIDESTGGFAEPIKNRMVVHFDGSYERFRHLLAHELTHPFQFSMTRGPGFASLLPTSGIYAIPLWFVEGMAEFFSLKWDAESDMIIRDAMYWNKLYSIDKLYLIEGSYLMYKEGQSILRFIANRYGEKKIGEIFRISGKMGGLNSAFESAIGVDTKELNQLWMKELKKHYWALCAQKNEEPENARRLTKHEGYFLNTAPSISPDGSEIVFLSDRDRYEGLYLMSSIDGRVKAKLVGGGRTTGFESLHIMHGGIGWHPNSREIAFVVKSQAKDVLYTLNVKQKKILKRFVPELDQIFSPSFSPDGKFIAIRGVKDGAADIYILNYSTGELSSLTQDQYDDLTPSWSPDGKYIVFSSDRPFDGDAWKYGQYTIFKADMAGQGPPQSLLKERATYVASPLWIFSDSLEDKIFFISNRNGVNNLYSANLPSIDETEITSPMQLTDVIGGIFTPSISKSGKFLTISSYINSGWDIYILKNPSSKGTSPNPKKLYDTRYTEIEIETEIEEDTSPQDSSNEVESKKLGLRFTPDWGGGAISYSTGGSFSGVLRLAVSDLLGNHRVYLETSSPNNLLANYYLTYFYLPRRLDFGIATFREEQYYYYWFDPDIVYRREILGGGFLLSCPTDKFHRADLELLGYKREEESYFRPEERTLGIEQYYQVGTSLAWIYDNSIWGHTGPMLGKRGKLSMYSALPSVSTFLYNVYKLDFRRYIGIGRRYSFAGRVINIGIWGKDKENVEDIWLGGPEDLRGYAVQDSIAGKNIGVLNLEFRYPFIDYINIAFPPISIRGIRGVLFCDFGYATNSFDPSKLRVFEDGRLQDLKFDFGTGVRMRFSYLIFKLNFAWNNDFVDTSKPYISFSLAPEF